MNAPNMDPEGSQVHQQLDCSKVWKHGLQALIVEMQLGAVTSSHVVQRCQ